MKDAVTVVDDAFRNLVRPEDVKVVFVNGLVAYRIIAIGRGQSLTRRSGGSIRFAVEIANVEDGSLVEDLRDLSECLS
jgi:hypothetical protein